MKTCWKVSDMISMTGEEVLLVFMSLGETYSAMDEIVDSKEFDVLSMDAQQYVLETQVKLYDLYERLAKYLEENKVPFVKHMFEADTKSNHKPKGMI